MKRRNTNWHKAAIYALQITLQNYSHLLEFYPEYVLGKNSYRIDLLLIKKSSNQQIPKAIAQTFQTYNLFEIKGIGSTLTPAAYYKTIGYAGLLIASLHRTQRISRTKVSLSFLCRHYPRKLAQYLTEECKLTIVKSAPGVYHISGDIFQTQILVTQELSTDENLYLKCLTNQLTDITLLNQLFLDYSQNQGIESYEQYMSQLKNTLNTTMEVSTMCGEWVFELCGTSSKEIAEHAAAEATAAANNTIKELKATIAELTAQIEALKEK